MPGHRTIAVYREDGAKGVPSRMEPDLDGIAGFDPGAWR
jgi:hypothetical protein